MCLSIARKSQRNKVKKTFLTKNPPNSKGLIKGYKWLQDRPTYPQRYFSYYREIPVKFGWNISDRKNITVSKKENNRQNIEEGCHIFIKKPTRYINVRKLFTVYFKPEDLVAVGYFHNPNDCAVVMKYYFPNQAGKYNDY